MRRVLVELRAHGAFEPGQIAGRLDNGHLHAEADAEVRNAVLARETHRFDLALDAAIAEASGHDDAVHIAQAVDAVLFDIVRLDEVDIDRGTRVNAAVLQRFDERNVGILEVHVLADHRDIDLGCRILLRLDDRIPLVRSASADRARAASRRCSSRPCSCIIAGILYRSSAS